MSDRLHLFETIVVSSSMEPTIPKGSRVYLTRDVVHINRGDVVLIRNPNGPSTLHRIKEVIDDKVAITKGDNLSVYDRPVRVDRIIAKMVCEAGRSRQC